MNVRHDRSYISENSRDLIGRGYAAEVLDTLRFRFTYTQVERDANRSRTQTQPYADGIAERHLLRPSAARIDWFEHYLTAHHLTVTVRREMGTDIQAACGQLRNKHLEE